MPGSQKQKWSKTKQKPLNFIATARSHRLSSFPDLSIHRPRNHWLERDRVSFEGPWDIASNTYQNFSTRFQKELSLFAGVTLHSDTQTFWQLLNTNFQRMLIPGDTNIHCVLSVQKGTYSGQVTDEVLSLIFRSLNWFMTYSSFLKFKIRLDILGNWQNPLLIFSLSLTPLEWGKIL